MAIYVNSVNIVLWGIVRASVSHMIIKWGKSDNKIYSVADI